jgi:hypothetical protein
MRQIWEKWNVAPPHEDVYRHAPEPGEPSSTLIEANSDTSLRFPMETCRAGHGTPGKTAERTFQQHLTQPDEVQGTRRP